jgi:hypothetical protein
MDGNMEYIEVLLMLKHPGEFAAFKDSSSRDVNTAQIWDDTS